MATVTISQIDGFQYALKMRWEKSPTVEDVHAAFDEINTVLNSASQKVWIVVDISSDPNFPLSATLPRASQAHRHENMGDWLVIGQNTIAKFIGATISTLSSSKVIWFDSELAAIRHLASVTV